MDKEYYRFLDKMLKRGYGDLYKFISKAGYTPAEFCAKAGIDPGNFSRMNQVVYKGAPSFWMKVWRAL